MAKAGKGMENEKESMPCYDKVDLKSIETILFRNNSSSF